MEIEFFCPYCGKQSKLTVKNALPSDIICDLCGSSIIDQAKEALQLFRQNPTNTSPDQLSRTPENYQMTPAFPKSMIARPETVVPPKPLSAPPVVPQSSGQAHLHFAQFNISIAVPVNTPEFHFGRNLLFPLVDSQKYDVDFLNAISRIKFDPQNRIVGEHFIIWRDKRGNYFIEDNNSKWGTWVNKQQIKGRGKVPLKKNDAIELMLAKQNSRTVFPLLINFIF